MGCYIPSTRTILLDAALQKLPEKYNFVLGHELGHLILHRKVIITESESESILDTEHTIGEKKKLVTELDFMEWQANYFASSFLLPKDIFITKIAMIRQQMDLSWPGYIYVDDQKCTRTDYFNTISLLSDYFIVSKTVVEIRLKELQLLRDNRNSYIDTLQQSMSLALDQIVQKIQKGTNDL